jgi:protein TonB
MATPAAVRQGRQILWPLQLLLMFWLALAAQMSLPTPANYGVHEIRAIFSAEDFPAYVQLAGISKTVFTRTTIRPDGTIQGCIAEISSGDTRLDAYTCGIILKRARFRPASWTDGTPAYGVIRVPVRWVISSSAPSYEQTLRTSVPDIDLAVNHLPKGAHSMAGVNVEIAAEENGRPVTCAEEPPHGTDEEKHRFPELVPIACQQAITSLRLSPPLDASGKPVRSVQSAMVRFILDH